MAVTQCHGSPETGRPLPKGPEGEQQEGKCTETSTERLPILVSTRKQRLGLAQQLNSSSEVALVVGVVSRLSEVGGDCFGLNIKENEKGRMERREEPHTDSACGMPEGWVICGKPVKSFQGCSLEARCWAQLAEPGAFASMKGHCVQVPDCGVWGR